MSRVALAGVMTLPGRSVISCALGSAEIGAMSRPAEETIAHR
jgi:hypothetical protein